MIHSRRTFFTGLTATLIAAPAIVRASSLMKLPARVVERYGASPGMLTLADWAARNRDTEEMLQISQWLTQCNEILRDMPWERATATLYNRAVIT